MIFNYVFKYFYLPTLVMLLSCSSAENDATPKYYQAIANRDTAFLKITKRKNFFYGQYIIQYGLSSKDSGEVQGKISGDTLIGDYFYIPRNGGTKKRTAFALLQKGKTLRLGTGAVMSFLDIPYYAPDVPINYDQSKFVFEEIKAPK
ncbi:hypothetical protein LZQ00_12115 [Sphingobacterium sp. SRCM116780]|uniref:hypothetical protein n=1 Tax=Sphingobacterium sp. SRCM116780 TaxID=2907623 RepID=UPI001F419AD7|nr:hypothetical protein [Sphingobacterium sp. SRCM116780]UIR55023.1 hypothetical protein LZQ00_12115 [Sphingobacterium sp. SRCM116780]